MKNRLKFNRLNQLKIGRFQQRKLTLQIEDLNRKILHIFYKDITSCNKEDKL
jgi:hypothetical protein